MFFVKKKYSIYPAIDFLLKQGKRKENEQYFWDSIRDVIVNLLREETRPERLKERCDV